MRPPANQPSNRRRSPRFKAQLKTRLLFSVLFSGGGGTSSKPTSGRLHLIGHTRDISETGVALVVPIAEIDERYLTGENTKMQIELYLPGGPIKITAKPVHYKLLDESSGESVFTEGYLIGAEITKVSNRDLFIEYLSTLTEKL
jgi:PilZ domain